MSKSRYSLFLLLFLLITQLVLFLAGNPGDLPLEDEAIGYAGRAQAMLTQGRLPHWSYSPLYSFWYTPFVAAMDPPAAIFIANLLLRLLTIAACWILMRKTLPAAAAFAVCLWWCLIEVHIGIPVGSGVFANLLLLCAGIAAAWQKGPLVFRGALVFWLLLGAGFSRPELFPILPALALGIVILNWNRRMEIIKRLRQERVPPKILTVCLLPFVLFFGWFILRALGWEVEKTNTRFFVTVQCFYPLDDLDGVSSMYEALRYHPKAIFTYFIHNAISLPRALALVLLLPSRQLAAWPALYEFAKWGAMVLGIFAVFQLMKSSAKRRFLLDWTREHRSILLLFGLAALATLPMALLLSPQRRFLTQITPFAGLLGAGTALAALAPIGTSARRIWKICIGVGALVLIAISVVGIPRNMAHADKPNLATYRILNSHRIFGGKIAGNVAPHYRSLLGLGSVAFEPSMEKCLGDSSCFGIVLHPGIAGFVMDSALMRLPPEQWTRHAVATQTIWIRTANKMDIPSYENSAGQ